MSGDDHNNTTDRMYAQNLRVLKHEAETPMRGHDEDGRCCLRARLGASGEVGS